MANDVSDFVNPKSMITPGVAAGVVATVAGALFQNLGIRVPFSLTLLSFFVGAVVFFSKEYADPEMNRIAKLFFYLLNSLVIFGMASGTHAMLGQGTVVALNTPFFTQTVYAQNAKTPAAAPVAQVKQSRPFFVDWTKTDPAVTFKPDVPVKFQVSKESSSWLDFVVAPEYKVNLQVDTAKLPSGMTMSDIKSVEWKLPDGDFPQDKMVTTTPGNGFSLHVKAWKSFPVVANIVLKSGETLPSYVQFVSVKTDAVAEKSAVKDAAK